METAEKEPLYTVVVPTAGGPAVSDKPKTAAAILKGHPSVIHEEEVREITMTPDGRRTSRMVKKPVGRWTAEEIATQCVAAGQWEPWQPENDTLSTDHPANRHALEHRLEMLEKELFELRRQKTPATNRMKDAGENR